MKVAISSQGKGLSSKVADRLGLAPYFIIIDPETMKYEAVRNPGFYGQTGFQGVALAIEQNVCAVLTGYCSPIAEAYLKKNNIRVITGVRGTVSEAIKQYIEMGHARGDASTAKPTRQISKDVVKALSRTGKQFGRMLPILVAVVLLMGLFKAFISKELLLSIFSGNAALDTILGACFGSVVPGNPINSYIIGGEMLQNGVSLFAVTAFLMTWVSVGLIQLPAEMMALGRKFSLLRNAVSLMISTVAAIVTVFIVNLIGG